MPPIALTRRGLGLGTLGLGGALALPATARAATAPGVTIHRHDQTAPFPVNAYILESDTALVVIDATLTNDSSRALRARADALGKPIAAVLLTHPHPDHYAGLGNLTEGLDVPIVSVAGVAEVARRDDAAKDQLIGGMFGEAWPRNRVFPNTIVADGDTLSYGGIELRVMDIGPAESFHDSLFLLDTVGARHAFVGDLIFTQMHAYMADNRNPDWTRALARMRSDLPEDTLLHVGHGAPTTPGLLPWQGHYLAIFEEALRAADWSNRDAARASVVARMQAYLPEPALQFLMEISIEPNAARLGLI